MPDRPDPLRGQPPPPPRPLPRLEPGRPFPPYRHTPGLTPHPRADPRGHLYGRAEHAPDLTPPERWRSSSEYLYAIDLYNDSFWWECHEALEGLWIAAGRTSLQAHFFQAIIQAAAANLKWHLQNESAARFLTLEASKKFDRLLDAGATGPTGRYMGVDVAGFMAALKAFHVEQRAPRDHPPLIQLAD